jgi:hypothetical protein
MIVVILATLTGYGLYWYEPWTLVVDNTVNDPLTWGPGWTPEPDPTHTVASEPYRLMGGTFVSQQHKTSGTARVMRNGRRITLELTDLDTSNGPDLRVWLSDQPVKGDKSGWRVFDAGRRVELGELKGNKGNQRYEIPVTADLTTVRSVTIWSGRFSVSYGAAALVA